MIMKANNIDSYLNHLFSLFLVRVFFQNNLNKKPSRIDDTKQKWNLKQNDTTGKILITTSVFSLVMTKQNHLWIS